MVAKNKKWTYLIIVVVLLAVFVLVFHHKLKRLIHPASDGGTPIIIKGGDGGDQYVEIYFDPGTYSKVGDTYSRSSDFIHAKITDGKKRCLIYNFDCFLCLNNQITMTTKEASAVQSVDVDDTFFGKVNLTFDVNNFDYTSGYYRSKNYRVVTGLTIKKSLFVKCTDASGNGVDCFDTWPNDFGTLQVEIDQPTATCP